MGSRPLVSSNRSATCVADTDQASLAWWQLAQLRPFVPRLWKNGPVRSTFPVELKLFRMPVELGKGKRFGRNVGGSCSAATTVTIPRRRTHSIPTRSFSIGGLHDIWREQSVECYRISLWL